jgi:hypothetical protein
MNAVCKFKCFFRGRSIVPGTAIDLSPDEVKLDIVKSSFTLTGTAEAKPEKDADLSLDEYRRRLSELGVTFDEKANKAALKVLYVKALSPNTSLKA